MFRYVDDKFSVWHSNIVLVTQLRDGRLGHSMCHKRSYTDKYFLVSSYSTNKKKKFFGKCYGTLCYHSFWNNVNRRLHSSSYSKQSTSGNMKPHPVYVQKLKTTMVTNRSFTYITNRIAEVSVPKFMTYCLESLLYLIVKYTGD